MKNKLYIFFSTFFCIATLFMGVGYASINSISFNLLGEVFTQVQEGVFITEINYNEKLSNNVLVTDSKINSSYQTNLDSNIVLTNDEDSQITYDITIYNSNDFDYRFNDVKYVLGEKTYSNENITFKLSNLSVGDVIKSRDDITFSLTFYYKDVSKISDVKLNSVLNFEFVINKYVVSFDANGGTVDVGSTELLFNELYGELPIPIRDGYVFSGWTSDEEGTNFITENDIVNIASDHTLFAQWKELMTILRLYNDGVLQIGDFINYELGVWNTENVNLIKTGHIDSLVSANNQFGLPTENFQFGGFEIGSKIGSNAFSDWLKANYNYDDYLQDFNTGESISGWRVFDIEDDGTTILISAGNPEDYVHPYIENAGYISDYILTGYINSNWNGVSSYQKRNWDMYKNLEQHAVSVDVLTKNKLEEWFDKYIVADANILDRNTFRLIYDSQYSRYHNIIDNWSYYWLPVSGESKRMYCVVPEDREISSPPQTFTFGVRLLVTLSPETLTVNQPSSSVTITTNSDDYYGDTIAEQVYNYWDIY